MFRQKKNVIVAIAALAGLLASAPIHAIVIESIQNGDLNQGTTWNGGVVPGAGDIALINDDTIESGTFALDADLLQIDSGQLRFGANPLTVNNVLLNGGKILGFGNSSTKLDVTGTLTLESGILESRNGNNRTLKIDAGNVVGTGVITINTRGQFVGNSIDIDSADLGGFTGTFLLDGDADSGNEGFDLIQDIDGADASFGLEIVQSKFRLTGNVSVISLIVDGDAPFMSGIYDFATLSGLGYAAFFTDEGGTITVGNGADIPEPTTAMLGLIGMAGLAARRRRHADAA